MRLYARYFAKQYVSIMPQVVSVWCRQLGHDTYYAAYYGQDDPKRLLPDDLDVIFISTYTKNSPLAYALAKLYRKENTLTVIGGPHAKAFPSDCLRFFDIVVRECDKSLIDDIVRQRYEGPVIVSSPNPLRDFPTVEERLPEIRASVFDKGRPSSMSIVPMLASVGCPYTCNFCIDWNNDYHALPTDRLRADLEYLSKNFPQVLVAYHDPNFGVKFDQTMDVMETIPPEQRNRYVMESSLSILKESRLQRLRSTNCVFVLPGVESWADYSNKAGVGDKHGKQKLLQVTEHLELLSRHVHGIQANLIFGTDSDSGSEPVELTEAFIRRLPGVWPAINIPIPYGGTPLTNNLIAEGRVIKSIPFAFYRNPYVTFRMANYDIVEYYEYWIRLRKLMMSREMFVRRVLASTSPTVRFMNGLRTLSMHSGMREATEQRDMLVGDKAFRSFHEGGTSDLPEYYHRKLDGILGHYASLVSRSDRIPILEQSTSAPNVVRMHPSQTSKFGATHPLAAHPINIEGTNSVTRPKRHCT